MSVLGLKHTKQTTQNLSLTQSAIQASEFNLKLN